MSDCGICRNYIPCKSENKDKVDKCFFVYPTEEYLAKDTKEYAIGYKQGIADERERIIAELGKFKNKHKGSDGHYISISNKIIEIVRGDANERNY